MMIMMMILKLPLTSWVAALYCNKKKQQKSDLTAGIGTVTMLSIRRKENENSKTAVLTLLVTKLYC